MVCHFSGILPLRLVCGRGVVGKAKLPILFVHCQHVESLIFFLFQFNAKGNVASFIFVLFENRSAVIIIILSDVYECLAGWMVVPQEGYY